jgi:WD40 repeat protein
VNALPDSPYKGLASFEDSELDALLFFGRGREIEMVVANVLASRLTVLYGPSGVGKSSLVGAGVARRLREASGAAVVVHDAWAEDPAAALAASVAAECGGLGATAGLVDTIAAAAQQTGELHLLLDQFEEYMLYHGVDGPLTTALPELLRRPGLRVNVLIAIRDDALAELDEFAGRIPELFGNLLRLDRLDREAGRAAIVGPLERYGELRGGEFSAEDALVDAVLDEVAEGRLDFATAAAPIRSARIEAPYLQLVLERLWEHERAAGSNVLRLATFRQIGGARAVVREHVQGALDRLTVAEQDAAERVVRQLVTPSGRKLSHEASDLAEYAEVDLVQLRRLLERLGRERIVRGVNGTPGVPIRYEIFHDVLGPPILAWQHDHQLRRERERARRQRRRLRTIIAATLAALAVVAALAVYALVQRGNANTQAQQARGRELAARALAEIPSNPQVATELALRATSLAPGSQTASVLRSSLLAMRETSVLDPGGNVVAASFSPSGGLLLVGSSDGKLGLFSREGRPTPALPRQPGLTTAIWSPNGRRFATGTNAGVVKIWRPGRPTPVRVVQTGSPIVALAYNHSTLLIASGRHVRLLHRDGGPVKSVTVPGGVVAAALDPAGGAFAVAFRGPKNTTGSELVDVRTGNTIRALRGDDQIHSFAFSPDGRLLVSGSLDKTARIWSARTGKLLHVLQHHGYVLDEAFSPDGTQLVTASSDGAAYVWDAKTGGRLLLLVGAAGGADAVAYSPDGSEIAVGSADRMARIFYAQDGRLLAPLAGHGQTVTHVAFDPSGRTLATASADGTVRLWSALPAGTLKVIDHRSSAVTTFWLGGDPVTIAGSEARILSTDGRVQQRLTLPGRPAIDEAATDGQQLALAGGGEVLLAGGGSSPTLEHRPGVTALAYSGKTLLLGFVGGDVRAATGGVHLHVPGPVLGLATGGHRILVRTAKELLVYTVQGELVSTIHTAASHATISPGGLGVATTSGSDGQLWDASTGKLLHTLKGHLQPITDVEYSPDGLDIVTTSYDHTGLIWSARRGRLIRRLIGHFFPVYSGNWSPDGHWIVTASQFTAGLWNSATGQLVFYLGRTAAPLTGASFSPTGDRILVGSKDGTARTYHCEICEPLPKLKALAAKRLGALGR